VVGRECDFLVFVLGGWDEGGELIVVESELWGVCCDGDRGWRGLTTRAFRGLVDMQNSSRENAMATSMVRSHAQAITETARYGSVSDEGHNPDAVRAVLGTKSPNCIWMALWLLSMAH
jgi:hypothetical protein